MWFETAQLYVKDGHNLSPVAVEQAVSALPDLIRVQVGVNDQGSWWAGAMTLDLHFANAQASGVVQQALSALTALERIDWVSYQVVEEGVREPDLQGGIWRTLLLRVKPERKAEMVAALERDLLAMPKYMAGIRNWRLSRVVSESSWTHVWQQEFARIEDLQGEYLLNPYHWGYVDRWFDPEFPEWTVEAISHAFCSLPKSLLGDDSHA